MAFQALRGYLSKGCICSNSNQPASLDINNGCVWKSQISRFQELVPACLAIATIARLKFHKYSFPIIIVVNFKSLIPPCLDALMNWAIWLPVCANKQLCFIKCSTLYAWLCLNWNSVTGRIRVGGCGWSFPSGSDPPACRWHHPQSL